MLDFVFIVESRVLRRDELGRPAKQRQNRDADEQKTANRDNDSDDSAEREIPWVHAPRLGGATDA